MLKVHRGAVTVSLGLVGALGLAGDRPNAAPVTYVLVIDEVRDLGTLSGHVRSVAHAINENGAIAGSSETAAGVRRAVFWPSSTAAPVNLWHLGGGRSEAWGINDAGVVVGDSRLTPNEWSRAFRWTQANGMSDLGLVGITIGGLAPVEYSHAYDINNNNVIVGSLGNENDGSAGFIYGWGVALVPACPSGLLGATANAINDSGFFTGVVSCQGGPWNTPYLGSLSTTNLLPTQNSPANQGSAINSSGVIASWWSDETGLQHAFRWSLASGFQDIHPANDTDYSIARGINEHGLIVGRKYTNGGNSRAFVYTSGLKMKTLPGLCGWSSWTSDSEAYAVNNSGWVAGASKTCAGDWHATLWKVRVVLRGYIDF